MLGADYSLAVSSAGLAEVLIPEQVDAESQQRSGCVGLMMTRRIYSHTDESLKVLRFNSLLKLKEYKFLIRSCCMETQISTAAVRL